MAPAAVEPAVVAAVVAPGTVEVVTAKITALGFPVTAPEMAELAASVGEKTMVGRTGGAVSRSLARQLSALRGFYLQDPDGDGDPATSDAIFVFNGGNQDLVELGLAHGRPGATSAPWRG